MALCKSYCVVTVLSPEKADRPAGMSSIGECQYVAVALSCNHHQAEACTLVMLLQLSKHKYE